MCPISKFMRAKIVCFVALHVFLLGAVAQQDSSYVPGQRFVTEKEMAVRCTTMISPSNSSNTSGGKPYFVVVRARVLRNGTVLPLYATSGPSGSRDAAMNAVRRWIYKPYEAQQTAVEVTTDISVLFEPGRPGGMISHPNASLR